MTGLTQELRSVEQGLFAANRWCIETYGKPPTHFVVGTEEYFYLVQEKRGKLGGFFLDIPIVVATRPGIDIGLPKPLSYKSLLL